MSQSTDIVPRRSFWTEGRRLKIAQISAGVVGLVLITAALIKATDMTLFLAQIKGYRIIAHPGLLISSAWALILAEMVLGTALLVSYRMKVIIPIVASLFFIFIGANVWAWMMRVTEDCGCFGTWLVRTPGEAVIEDIVLLIALIPAWLGHRHSHAMISPKKIGIVAAGCLLGLLMPVFVSGLPVTWITAPQMNTIEIEIENLQIQGIDDLDLKQGDFIIALMLTDCDHCQDAVPTLSRLVKQSGLPRVIALTPNDEEQRKIFIELFGPSFPIGQIDLHAFLRLLGDGDVPRFILIRDGRLLHQWNDGAPDADLVLQAL
jgi:hypothetical protein